MTERMAAEHLPLAGTRILDLTHVWSGPMATRILAGLGAEVIKLENPGKPDALRGNESDIPLRYPDLLPGADSVNRNAWFNTQNVDKKGVVLDLKAPDGMRLVREIIQRSDAVVANFRPGVLERMGLGFATLTELNPSIVLVEMPGYTADSPNAGAPAFGAQFDAQSGSATLTGGTQGPLLTGYALGDPASGLMAANAVVSALLRSDGTEEPSHIVLAQSEAMMPLLGEYFLAESVGCAVREATNADRRHVPQGVFRTRNGDWLGVSIADDSHWSSLNRLLTGVDPELEHVGTHAERRAADRRISDALTRYVGQLDDAAEAAGRLQEQGIPAAPLQGAKALLDDPQLAKSGFFQRLDHPSCGDHRYPGLPVTIDGQRIGTRTRAPRFMEDTATVLSEVLGIGDDEIARLSDQGIAGVIR